MRILVLLTIFVLPRKSFILCVCRYTVTVYCTTKVSENRENLGGNKEKMIGEKMKT